MNYLARNTKWPVNVPKALKDFQRLNSFLFSVPGKCGLQAFCWPTARKHQHSNMGWEGSHRLPPPAGKLWTVDGFQGMERQSCSPSLRPKARSPPGLQILQRSLEYTAAGDSVRRSMHPLTKDPACVSSIPLLTFCFSRHIAALSPG